MPNPPWLEEIRANLTSQGLPQPYIERLVRELRDHHNDIIDEGMNMESEKNSAADQRMGQPAHIAEAAACEYSVNSPLYCHTQKTPKFWRLSWFMFALLLFALGFQLSDDLETSLLQCLEGLLFVLIGLSFQQLTVSDEGVRLNIRFGPLSLYRAKILYSDIQKVEVGEFPFIGPPGHKGRLLSLWGTKYVAIQLQKSQIKLGTDDPANLAAFLQGKISQCASGAQVSA